MATTLRPPNVRVRRTCGARANGWNGAPVLNETTSGKQSVMNMACQNWPTRSSVLFHSSLTNACRSRKPFVSPSAVPKNSPSMRPDVFAPRASGPVTFPTSRVWIERMLKTGPALMSVPAGSSHSGLGEEEEVPLAQARRLTRIEDDVGLDEPGERDAERGLGLVGPRETRARRRDDDEKCRCPSAHASNIYQKARVMARADRSPSSLETSTTSRPRRSGCRSRACGRRRSSGDCRSSSRP